MSYLTSKAMQTTAIGTVANSLPENKVILITLLNSSRYIPYTDLQKIYGISDEIRPKSEYQTDKENSSKL